MIALLSYVVCFTWLLTAILNVLFMHKVLPDALRKRRAHTAEFESERKSRMIVVTRFLAQAPYIYFRFTNLYVAICLVDYWDKFSNKQQERRSRSRHKK